MIQLKFTSESQIIRKMCYPPNAIRIILNTSSQSCHVIHFHGNNNIKIVRLSNSIECFTHKALALKQQKIHHPLCNFKAAIMDLRLSVFFNAIKSG